MPAVDRLIGIAVLLGTGGVAAVRAIGAFVTFRQVRRMNELLEKALAELEHERIGNPR
jgi:hypothetical protein